MHGRIAGFAMLASLVTVLALAPTTSGAQSPLPTPVALRADTPPAPVPPEVLSRDSQGRATLRAIRIAQPLKVDGKLEEPVYNQLLAAGGFIQQQPKEGAPATEQTDVWVFFDDRNLYVAARCWDSHPERVVANDMRRDSTNIRANDHFAVIFDTFHDRRNGFHFYVNPVGGMVDGQVTDERTSNNDWNTVWDGKSARFEQGWTVEMIIPFKSLRYPAGKAQVWGINFRRVVRWKNEWSFLTPISASANLTKVSFAGMLVGLEAPPPTSRNFEVKPYAIAGVRTELTAKAAIANDLDGKLGFDAKYGVTKSLTADFTYNTDFAQVEADEQQVNLTRFSLFFPEKRDFFLEGQGIFLFGGVAMTASSSDPSYTPILFFSRRIGLESGREIPIRAGGRLTGKVGKYSVGLLTIQSGDEPVSRTQATNFSVVRVKRDIFRRSAIGAMMTRRSVSKVGNGVNELYAIDATLSFYEALDVNAYLARTRTPGMTGNDTSYRAQLDYAGDRYGLQLEQLAVGDSFSPEVGFLRRADFRRSFGLARFSPRTKSNRTVRRFVWQGSYDYFANGQGVVETREGLGTFRIEFHNGDTASLQYSRNYEFLESPFSIAPGINLPAGGYTFQGVETYYLMGTQRKMSGTVTYAQGSFYEGDRRALTYRGRGEVTPRLVLEPSVSVNWIDLPQGRFTTKLVSTRATFTITPRMFAAALVQYNSSATALSTNVRLRWEYRPGSEFFLVYSDGRDTGPHRFPVLQNWGFVVKINRLVRF